MAVEDFLTSGETYVDRDSIKTRRSLPFTAGFRTPSHCHKEPPSRALPAVKPTTRPLCVGSAHNARLGLCSVSKCHRAGDRMPKERSTAAIFSSVGSETLSRPTFS
ncbi:unnamed protein product [Arctogadus glacialis]